MNLVKRLELLSTLRSYLVENTEAWQTACERAQQQNLWFVPSFTQYATDQIVSQYLAEESLQQMVASYPGINDGFKRSKLGLVMAGNIPLVGFHDFMCCFIAGVPAMIKPSSKESVLITHVLARLQEWCPELKQHYSLAEQLKGCDAYIATGSNNSSRYFEYYFRNHPHIIRKNRTSAAILSGNENEQQLKGLADDMLLYFGLGCRSVSHLFVPEHYTFEPLLAALDAYQWMKDHSRFRNNYDYNLALHLMNGTKYMTDGNLLFVANESVYSPISQINYSSHEVLPSATEVLQNHAEIIQCVVDGRMVGFGKSQQPGILDYADGEDTMQFLLSLS